MFLRTQAGVWTQLDWWAELHQSDDGLVTLVRVDEGSTLTVANVGSKEVAIALGKEMSHRVELGFPHFDVQAFVASGDLPVSAPETAELEAPYTRRRGVRPAASPCHVRGDR